MLHLHSGSYHVLMNSVKFGREVKSFTSSGRELQILGPNVAFFTERCSFCPINE